MKIAALFPVGTSDGGCPLAIGEILKYEASLDVILSMGSVARPMLPTRWRPSLESESVSQMSG
jgi:hypothetical protein